MSAAPAHKPIVHFVGSIPLPDAETVFRTLSAATGPHLQRLPDGETGIRKTWIRFLQQVLADNPAIEVASDVPPFKFTQWDGKLLREIPRLRVKPGARLDPATVKTGYADMAIESWRLFDRLQQEGVIPAGVKFQISLQVFRMPVSPSGRRFRCGPVAAARVRNTVSESGNGMLPTKWTIGLCAGAALITALSPQPTFAGFPAAARPGSRF